MQMSSSTITNESADSGSNTKTSARKPDFSYFNQVCSNKPLRHEHAVHRSVSISVTYSEISLVRNHISHNSLSNTRYS